MQTDDNILMETIAAARADRTVRAYEIAWRSFINHRGDSGLPASPTSVALYLSDLGQKSSPATVRLHAAAIAAMHRDSGFESPTENPAIRKVLSGVARINGCAPKQSAGLDADVFEAISESAMTPRVTRGGRLETQTEANFRGLVDVTLIGTMRDGMLRRSEAAALVWGDVTPEPDGTARVRVVRSKTDQTAMGEIMFISEEVAECLETLRLLVQGQPDQTVFNLSGSQICRRIAAAARAAGVKGHFSGHSPRIGMAQDLVRAGASLPAVMSAGRWKTATMPAYYTRSQAVGSGAVAAWHKSRTVH